MPTKQLRSWIKKHQIRISLTVILALASFFRLWQLGRFPPAFHADEIMNAYVGEFVIENGVDLYGNRWPLLYFDNFGDYPNIIPMYLSGFFTYIFGTTVWAVRLPIALLGISSFIVLYLLGKNIFRDQWVPLAMIIALLLQPWHLVMSRATAEGVAATAIMLWASWLLLLALRNKKYWQLSLATIMYALTYLLYPGFRVFIPVLLLPTFLLATHRKWKIVMAIITTAFFLATLWMSQQYWAQGRFTQTSTFTINTPAYVFQQKFTAGLGPDKVLTARILYNKPVMYTRQLVKNYLSYWSPEFLMIAGGKPDRYLVPDQGMIFYSWLLLVVFFLPLDYLRQAGFKNIDSLKSQTIFTKQGRASYYWLLYGLAISPLPAALTIDDIPNVHRALVMSVLLTLPVGYLFARTRFWRWRKIPVWGLIFTALALEFGYFWHQYLVQAPYYQAYARQADSRQNIDRLFKEHQNFTEIWAPSNAANVLYYLFLKDDFSYKYAGAFSTGLFLPKVDNINFYAETCPPLSATNQADLIIAPNTCDPTPFNNFQQEELFNHFWWQQKQ